MAPPRKGRKTNILVWIILGLLIVGLMGFGIGNFTGTTDRFGSVGSTDLKISRYVQVYQNVAQNMLASNPELAGTGLIESEASRSALGLVMEAAAIDNEAGNAGVSVGDRSVLERIRQFPAFQGINGQFDAESYEFYLERNGLSEAEFDELLREEETRSLLTGIVAQGIGPLDSWSDAVVTYLLETRDVRWAEVTDSMVDADKVQGNAGEYRNFHADNPDLFTVPERRELTYVWLTPEMISDKQVVSEDELRALYDERIDEFNVPERRIVERLVFPELAAASQAADEITNGTMTFEELAAGMGILIQDIELGPVARSDLTETAAEVVFSAGDLGVVGPVDSSIGPALFRISGILAASEMTFDQARENLRGEIVLEMAERLIADRIETYNDLLAEGATLETLGSTTEMQLDTLSFDDGSGAKILSYPEFRTAAQSVSESDYPEILSLADGGAFAVRLDGITEPRQQSFEEVEERVIELWSAQAILDRKIEVASRIAETLDGTADFSSAGFDTVQFEESLARGTPVTSAPFALTIRAFELDDAGAGVASDDSRVVVLRVESINAPVGDDVVAENFRTLINSNADRQMGNNTSDQYAAYILDNANLRLDQQVLNSVNAQLQAQYASAP